MKRIAYIRQLEDKIDRLYQHRREAHTMEDLDKVNNTIIALQEVYHTYTHRFYIPTRLFKR